MALDAHVELEDEALYSHPELASHFGIQPRPTQARPPTPFESAAAQIDATDSRGSPAGWSSSTATSGC